MTASLQPISPLRQRMLDDMRMRKFGDKTQLDYVRAVRNFTKYLGRSPDSASVEDLRNYQLHLVDHGLSPTSLNVAISGLKFFFDVTLDHPELVAKMQPAHLPRKLPVILSPDEVKRLIAAAGNLKHQTALALAYATGLRVLGQLGPLCGLNQSLIRNRRPHPHTSASRFLNKPDPLRISRPARPGILILFAIPAIQQKLRRTGRVPQNSPPKRAFRILEVRVIPPEAFPGLDDGDGFRRDATLDVQRLERLYPIDAEVKQAEAPGVVIDREIIRLFHDHPYEKRLLHVTGVRLAIPERIRRMVPPVGREFRFIDLPYREDLVAVKLRASQSAHEFVPLTSVVGVNEASDAPRQVPGRGVVKPGGGVIQGAAKNSIQRERPVFHRARRQLREPCRALHSG
jgi:hypothetical protein